MSSDAKHDHDSFPEENELDDKSKLDSLGSSEHEEDSDIEEETLHDLMADFFLNDNGDNIATILTNIQTSIDQNSKCLLKLTKVIQEYMMSASKK
jgi:hypothetical protein